ncbi:response regulator [Gemmatimonas groenlandica]|uniref:Response regulator n=1 Tax=Gemmatimonas groenlandica TaxID=2732249 RepID=A0A6M4IQA9_9BACT|nr:response regulator [Gemmatimonas groenlandica]QJR35939.1 response regulator [Gemmatimonas groenlandica]
MNARDSRDRTILIVEDNEDNRAIYGTMLRARGYAVLESTDGESGVATARRECPDLVLMDIGLPIMDGLDATRLLKSDPTTATIPIVVLTAHALRDERQRAQLAGVTGYLVKPVSSDELVAAVERALGGDRSSPPPPDGPQPRG